MGAKKKYSSRITRNSQSASINQGSLTEVDDFVLAVLSEGLNYESTNRFLAKVEIERCSKSTFFAHQAKLAPFIIEAAIESCKRARKLMTEDSCLSMDGSWSSRRHAQHCFVSLCDVITKKIADFTVVSRTSDFFLPKYTGSSQAMEMTGFEELVKVWTTNLSYPKVKNFVHDNDVKAVNIIKKYKWDVQIYLDPNHVFKNIKKSFLEMNEKNLKNFGEIKDSFESFLNFLVNNLDLTKEKRLQQYDNMYAHYMGNHENCIHSDINPVTIWNSKQKYSHELLEFLVKQRVCIEQINPRFRTQMNECVNYIKGLLASKNFSYTKSFALRCCIAVLQTNEPETWYNQLRHRIGLRPLPMKFCLQLYKLIVKSVNNKRTRSTPEYKAKKYKSRKAYLKIANMRSNIGHANCDPPEYKQTFDTCSYKSNSFNVFSYDFLPNIFSVNHVSHQSKVSRYTDFFKSYNINGVISIPDNYRNKETDIIIIKISDDRYIDIILNDGGTVDKKKLKLTRVAPKNFKIYEKSLLVSNIDQNINIEKIVECFEQISAVYIASMTSDSKNENKKIAIVVYFSTFDTGKLNNFSRTDEINDIIVQRATIQSAFEFINTRNFDACTIELYPEPTHCSILCDSSTVSSKLNIDKIDEEDEFHEEEDPNCEEEEWNNDKASEEENTVTSDSDSDVQLIEGDFAADCLTPDVIEHQFQQLEIKDSLFLRTPLSNKSKTVCFLNSVVQAIANIEELADFFITHSGYNKIFGVFSSLLTKMMQRDCASVDPVCLVTAMRKPTYLIQQQDAAEFLHTLYEQTINSMTEKEPEGLFTGSTTSFYECQTEQWETEPIPFVSVELPIKRYKTLIESLIAYYSPKKQKDIKINETKIEDGTIQLIIKSLPHILTIILNRFDYDKFCNITTKNNQRLVFPFILKTEGWCDVECNYNLTAVIAHEGTADSGHYKCYAYHAPNWYLYNDEKVSLIGNYFPDYLFGDRNFCNTCAYILFYRNSE